MCVNVRDWGGGERREGERDDDNKRREENEEREEERENGGEGIHRVRERFASVCFLPSLFIILFCFICFSPLWCTKS